jgi:hypothetical protein
MLVAKVRSRLLVIDASIARAAGDASAHPTAERCREFLQAVLDLCHRMVLTAPIQAEWNKHQSGFARRWRTSMMARKKVELVEIAPHHSLEKRIGRAASSVFIAAIMEKDRHLIEAALVAEERVFSLDDRVRKHFQQHATMLREVGSVHWVNPGTAGEAAVAWLKAAARDQRSRTLGHRPTRSKK